MHLALAVPFRSAQNTWGSPYMRVLDRYTVPGSRMHDVIAVFPAKSKLRHLEPSIVEL